MAKNRNKFRLYPLVWAFGAILSAFSSLFAQEASIQSVGAVGDGYFSRLVGISAPVETCSAATAEATGDGLRFSDDVILRGALGIDSCRAFQVWGTFYAGGGKIKPLGFTQKIDQDLDGAMVGLTLGLGSAFSFTGYYNYHDTATECAGTKISTDTQLGGIGLRYNVSGFYFSLLGNYGDDGSTLRATEAEDALDFDGWQATGFFETGFQWPTSGRLFVLTPFSNLQYSTVEFDGFDRSRFALTGDKTQYDAFYQTLGSRIDLNLPGCDLLGLQGRLAWVHQYLSDAAPISNYQIGRIPGTITPTSVYYEGNAGRDWFWCGAGLKLSLFNLLSATLDYDILLNERQTTHLGSVGLLIGF